MAGGKVEGGVESGAMGEWKSKGFGKTPKPSSFWMNTKTDRLKIPTDFFFGDTLLRKPLFFFSANKINTLNPPGAVPRFP